jgi:uncharacterized protein YjbI with pentapeptide repeats
MNQLKPMIIVLLMLTSALAGCTGTDTTDLEQQIEDLQQSNDQMNDTISQKNYEITLLQGLNSDVISDAEAEKNSLLEQLEDSKTSSDNLILALQSDLAIQQNLVTQWKQNAEDSRTILSGVNMGEADLTGAIMRYTDLSNTNLYNSKLHNADLRYADLSNTYLSGADLTDADLTGADLTGADLNNADLTGANLNGADLRNANLHRADLTDADLTGADLTGADLSGALLFGTNLYYADLSNADLNTAQMTGVNLSGADLNNANLMWIFMYNTDLTGADLTDAEMAGAGSLQLIGCPALLPTDWNCRHNSLFGPNAHFGYTDLIGFDLSDINLSYIFMMGADLTGADLSFADLTGADLSFADLTGADLSFADLIGADLSNANLYDADLTGAELNNVYWYDTICPDGTNSDNNGNTCVNNL